MIQIHHKDVDGIAIIGLDGRLVSGGAVEHLRSYAGDLIALKPSVILDLARVSMVDSSGLGILISLQTKARASGGAVKLLNTPERHVQLLVLTKLSTEFEMFNDEQAAVDSFFPDRKRAAFDILEFVQDQVEKKEAGAD